METVSSRYRTLKLPAPLMLLILIALATGGYEAELGGLTLTMERVLAGPLLAVSLLICLQRPSRLSAPFLLLVLWLFVALLSSVAGPVSGWAIRMWLLLCSAYAYYFAVVVARVDALSIISSRAFTLLAFATGVVPVIVYLVHISGVELGVLASWVHESGGGVRLTGSLIEPNIFACFVSVVAFLLLGDTSRSSATRCLLILSLCIGLVLSFSRVPWAAFILGLMVYFAIVRPGKYDFRKAFHFGMALLFAALAVYGLVAAVWYLYSDVELIGRSGSVLTRLYMWRLAGDDIREYPLTGTGVFSFSALHPAAMYAVGSTNERAIWISNQLLLLVHDTGLVGAMLWVAAIGLLLLRALVAVRSSATAFGRTPAVRASAALIASLVALMFSSQSIPTLGSAFFWFLLGLLEVNTRVLRSSPQ